MEKEIVDKGLTYPRVTLDEIQSKMEEVQYDCHIVPGTTTTVVTAYIVMGHVNFTLVTEIMACVDPRNFNEELGKKYGIEKAKKSAMDKLWELEGYRLAHSVASEPSCYVERVKLELAELTEKLNKLDEFITSEHFTGLAIDEQNLLVEQSRYMENYADVLVRRLAGS